MYQGFNSAIYAIECQQVRSYRKYTAFSECLVINRALCFAYQMAQEGALWPSVMITLGPCWHKVN